MGIRVIVTTDEGEVLESFQTRVALTHRWPSITDALADAYNLADLGLNEWEEEDA